MGLQLPRHEALRPCRGLTGQTHTATRAQSHGGGTARKPRKVLERKQHPPPPSNYQLSDGPSLPVSQAWAALWTAPMLAHGPEHSLSWAPPPRPRPTFQVPSQAAASRVVPPARPAAWGGRGAWPERWVHVPASSSQVQPVVVSLPMGSGEERPSLSPQMVPAEPLRAEKADPSPE